VFYKKGEEMPQDEIHDKSPNESVGQFFSWMYKKAVYENRPISGKMGGVLYQLIPDPYSIGRAFDKYLENCGVK